MHSIHDFLVGENHLTIPQSSYIDYMHLAQHVARCPVAIQKFLDRNPHYWPFVPMLINEARQQNDLYVKSVSISNNDDDKLRQWLNHVPIAPPGYQFSEDQRHQQLHFFQRGHHHQLPDIHLHPYMATIIAVCMYQNIWD